MRHENREKLFEGTAEGNARRNCRSGFFARTAALSLAAVLALLFLASCQDTEQHKNETGDAVVTSPSGSESTKEEGGNEFPSPSYAYEYAWLIAAAGNTRDIAPSAVTPSAEPLPDAVCPDRQPSAAFETEGYDENCTLVRLPVFSGRRELYGVHMRTCVSFVNNGGEAAVPVFSEDIPLRLTLYMGYVIEDGDNTVVYDREGRVLLTAADDFPAPANTRDADGAPLFLTAEGAYLKIENGAFVPADYEDARDSRGLYFDYPASYGTPDGTLVRLAVTGEAGIRYGYGADDATVIPAAYAEAYAFREGAATVKLAASGYGVIGEDGGTILSGSRYYTNENRRRVLSRNVAPADPGIFGLGAYYRDEGLLRVRTQDSDFENGGITADRDWLMRQDGSEFPIPSGFSLVSYSDGVLLLRSDNTGYYGMYAAGGYWVAQPVFTYARPFVGGLAVLGFSEGYRGVIDTAGHVVLPFRYDFLSDFSSGLFAAYTAADGWEVFALQKQNG